MTAAPVDLASTTAPDVARLRRWARLVLVPVGLIGAVLSFASIYEAAVPTFGPVLAAGVPLLGDFLILGASLQYIAGAKVGRPRAGWRLTSHGGVAATLMLNALAAPDVAHLPWHVIAPAVWSVLTEMTAREVLGEWKATHEPTATRIPARLWLAELPRVIHALIYMARTGQASYLQAFDALNLIDAAVVTLRHALPARRDPAVWTTRRRTVTAMRRGALDPRAILDVLDGLPESARATTVQRAINEVVLGDERRDMAALRARTDDAVRARIAAEESARAEAAARVEAEADAARARQDLAAVQVELAAERRLRERIETEARQRPESPRRPGGGTSEVGPPPDSGMPRTMGDSELGYLRSAYDAEKATTPGVKPEAPVVQKQAVALASNPEGGDPQAATWLAARSPATVRRKLAEWWAAETGQPAPAEEGER